MCLAGGNYPNVGLGCAQCYTALAVLQHWNVKGGQDLTLLALFSVTVGEDLV